MAPPGRPPSKRDKIRDAAACLLRDAVTTMHVSDIAAVVLPALDLVGIVTVKDVNTTLHDDPQRRFDLVAKGTWKLNPCPVSQR